MNTGTPDQQIRDIQHRLSALGKEQRELTALLEKKPTPWLRSGDVISAQEHTAEKADLLGLDVHPCDQILLMQLAFLHEFVPMHREVLARYTRACDEEPDSASFALLAQAFDEAANSFEYDALEALRERYASNPAKSETVAKLLKERAKLENEVVSF